MNPQLNATPAADPDGDGKTNRQEYVYGLIPTSGASANEIVTQLNQATALFSYTRRLPAQSGAVFRYQWSTTLSGPWAEFTPDAGSSNNLSPVEIFTVDLPDALLTNSRLFVRVITP